ncbi:glycosyltransferase family 1 protein [Candidatus Deferrimicrobium sp.]|uniref:glycosyltransferase family 4 protein n=1 Tax=Candidatus Deferrimicrobium sp. TaxID=3060586 RepID=UPI00271BEE0C|nr:glycosyltransferase family 1 protein [Candidatus Deferrimicrobium sp.]MDO8738902.1 glycosyltransferase family 1 protein [Candidatus Deferrimicrobium sp.]
MKVCIDLTPALYNPAGTGRYVKELSKAFIGLGHGPELSFFAVDPEGRVPEPPLDVVHRTVVRWPKRLWSAAAGLSFIAGVPMDRYVGRPDLFHATWHLLPGLSASRSVMTLYDLTFATVPGTHLRLLRWSSNFLVPRFLRGCRRIIAISESTKRDAIRLYGIPEEKVVVTHLAVDARFRPASPEAVAMMRERYRLPDRFLLYVGTIEPRKNLSLLLDALKILVERGVGVPLVVAGARGWMYEDFFLKVRKTGLEGKVLFTGYIPDEELPGLYSAAEAFLYPSLYEGFGFPVLEAMACGTPVVCSNTSSLPEVAGAAAVLLSPHAPGDWADTIKGILDSGTLRERMRQAGFRQASRFRWEKTARETWEVYRLTL